MDYLWSHEAYIGESFYGDISATAQDPAWGSWQLPSILPISGLYSGPSSGYAQSSTNPPPAPMGPPTEPRKRKAPTLRAKDWEPYKTRILQLQKEGFTIPRLIEKIKTEYGFIATPRQYQKRITEWGQDKNVKPHEMQAIVRKRQKRKLVETDKTKLAFKVRDNPVPSQKIERWMRNHNVVESALYAPSPAASTPSAVGCRTISERGSPAPNFAQSPAAFISSPNVAQFSLPSLHISSSLLSVSSVLPAQGSNFAGQSPAIMSRGLPNLDSSWIYTASRNRNQNSTVPLSRYKQKEEEQLQHDLREAEVLEFEVSDIVEILLRLAYVHIEQGRYKTAEETTRRLFQSIQDQHNDGDEEKSLIKLKALNLLGGLRQHQGLYIEAEKVYQQAAEGGKKFFGSEHPEMLLCLSRLGEVLIRLGKYNEAQVLLKRVLDMKEKLLGPWHPDISASIRALSLLFWTQGEYKMAEVAALKALAIDEKIFGPKDADTMKSIKRLGDALLVQNKYEEAEALYRKALDVQEKTYGPEHPRTLVSMASLGLVLSCRRKYNEAEILLRRTLDGQQKILGPEHPHTLITIVYLGGALCTLGQYKEAETLQLQAMEKSEKVLGSEHPYTLGTIFGLAIILKQQSRSQEAVSLLRQCCEACQRILGADNPHTDLSVQTLDAWLMEESTQMEF